jgi:ankyrin repeat protein
VRARALFFFCQSITHVARVCAYLQLLHSLLVPVLFPSIARKKAQKKQRETTTLVPHRTPNLSALLEEAETGNSAQAVKAYLDAGGLPGALVYIGTKEDKQQLPLLHFMMHFNAHPHTELAESVRVLLEAGVNINSLYMYPDGIDYTALMAATDECCTVVQVLLQNGADPSVHTTAPPYTTALHKVASTGRIDSCRLLLARDSNLVHLRDVNECTPMMLAARVGHIDIVRLLLEHGADVNAISKLRSAALIAASLHNHVEVVDCLLKAGADVNATDSNGYCALMAAVEGECMALPVVQLLLDHGANVDGINKNGRSALLIAAHCGRVCMMELLLQRGCSITAVDYNGNTVLMTAAATEQRAAAEWSLQHGVDVHAVDRSGQNVLLIAARLGNVAMLELLVLHGLSVHAADNSGETLLMVVVSRGHKAAAEWLLQHSVSINATKSNGFTALHSACTGSSDHVAMIELLLANGADLHHCAYGQATALYVAVHYCNLQCARALIAAGVDVHIVDSNGMMLLHMAVMSRRSALVQLLLEHSAPAVMNRVVPIVCPRGANCCTQATPLMMCSTVDTVKLLLAAGADVHVTTDAGDTCLHVAVRHSYKVPVICLLIKAGADLHAVNNRGMTAAQLAHLCGIVILEQILNRAAQQERSH